VGLNRWMQVEAHGELIAIGRNEFSACWRKRIFAVEPAPVGRKHEQALVDDVENLAVTVMRNAQDGAIPLLLTRDRDLAGAGYHWRAVQHPPDGTSFNEAA